MIKLSKLVSRNFTVTTAFVVVTTMFSAMASAAEKIEETVLGMNVSGTKDLPNVLYIVPWKANTSQIPPPEISRLVDEIYAPVDPEVFAKQVKFYYQLTNKAEAETPIPPSDQ